MISSTVFDVTRPDSSRSMIGAAKLTTIALGVTPSSPRSLMIGCSFEGVIGERLGSSFEGVEPGSALPLSAVTSLSSSKLGCLHPTIATSATPVTKLRIMICPLLAANVRIDRGIPAGRNIPSPCRAGPMGLTINFEAAAKQLAALLHVPITFHGTFVK
ncbi:MAG: hypothetical protein H0V17_29205 [Deltaproteobacteria bacterium]|nr:hypothetical protein [Deltaproteobacteria bacterium]